MTKIDHLQSAGAPAVYTVPKGTSVVVVEEGSGGDAATIVKVGENSTLLYAVNLFADTNLKRTISLELAQGARAELIGLLAGSGNAAIDLRLHEDHVAGASWARMTVRGALFQSSQLLLNGKISIRHPANQSDGLFEGRVVLVDESAKAEIVPSLEIEARDVKATHAAAAGPLDADALFYLMSRGCTLEEASSLMLQGFFGDLLQRISDTDTQSALTQQWTDRLSALLKR